MVNVLKPEIVDGSARQKKKKISSFTTNIELAVLPFVKLILLIIVTLISYVVPDLLPFVDEGLLTLLTVMEFRDLKNRIFKK